MIVSNTLLESLWARVDTNIGSRITKISELLTQSLSANDESKAARDAGGRIQTADPVGAATGDKGSEEVLATINVPSGETWLIAVMGDLTPRFAKSSQSPSLYLGSHKTNGYTEDGPLSMAILTNQTVTLRIVRGYSTGTDTFAGQVYTVKM